MRLFEFLGDGNRASPPRLHKSVLKYSTCVCSVGKAAAASAATRPGFYPLGLPYLSPAGGGTWLHYAIGDRIEQTSSQMVHRREGGRLGIYFSTIAITQDR